MLICFVCLNKNTNIIQYSLWNTFREFDFLCDWNAKIESCVVCYVLYYQQLSLCFLSPIGYSSCWIWFCSPSFDESRKTLPRDTFLATVSTQHHPWKNGTPKHCLEPSHTYFLQPPKHPLGSDYQKSQLTDLIFWFCARTTILRTARVRPRQPGGGRQSRSSLNVPTARRQLVCRLKAFLGWTKHDETKKTLCVQYT